MNLKSLIINNDTDCNCEIGLYSTTNKVYFKELHDIQCKAKSYITKCGNWSILKRKNENNIYNKKNDINNIIKLDICSRSYLKLIEICQIFSLCKDKQINYLALAEAPGGFIEAFMELRKKEFLGRNDKIITMSLYKNSYDTPKYIFKNKHNFNIQVTYGIKCDGNICDLDNIYSIKNLIDEKFNFITADGGIDFSQDYNNQEKTIFKLLFAEILSAFIHLEEEGIFILKIFDILRQNTMELIYILSIYFEKVIIYKPYLSRSSNSEKYLVCINFRGITNKQLDKLKIIYEVLDDINISNYSMIKEIPINFIEKIYEYDEIIIAEQIKNIFKTILKVNNYENILDNFSWCKRYINN